MRIHPCAALALDPTFKVTGAFPKDLAMLPAESLQLYDAMSKQLSSEGLNHV